MGGHGCEVHGGEGWKVGAPRVGRQWDIESSGWWDVGCSGSDTLRVAVVAGQHVTGRGASDGAGWHTKGGGGGTRQGWRPIDVGRDTWVGGAWAREKAG